MIKRFLGFVSLGLLLVGFGYLFYENPSTVEFRFSAARAYALPLPLLLLLAFLCGALLIFILALARETQWTVADLRRRRRERKLARQRAALAAGRQLHWAGRSDQAQSVLRRQLRSPEGLEATLSLAEASLDGEVPGEAIELLEGSRKTYATEPRLLALLARAYRQIGQPHPATVCLEQAVALAPKSPRLLAELRDAYAAEGRWAEALRTEDSLLTSLRRPDQILAEQPRIRALRYEAALVADGNAAVVRELRSIHARDPAFVPAAVSLGDGLKHSGQFREASRVWLRTVRLRPEPVLLSRIESLFKELERPKKVLALYRRLRRRGDSLPLLLRHVRFLVSEGRVNEAAEELEQAGARFSHVSELQALWGEVHRLRGNSDKALEAFRRALENQLALEAPVHCGRCARAVTEWQARCPGCGAWDSLQSATR